MPFGLANAPATFQSYIDKALSHLFNVTVIVYLDDILVYSDNPEDHEKHVKEVLKALRRHGNDDLDYRDYKLFNHTMADTDYILQNVIKEMLEGPGTGTVLPRRVKLSVLSPPKPRGLLMSKTFQSVYGVRRLKIGLLYQKTLLDRM